LEATKIDVQHVFTSMMSLTVVGLDLAGAETRPTGFCILTGLHAETTHTYKDQETLARIIQANPQVVAIDAPLSLPPGRKTLEERTGPHLRESDKELQRRGIRFFPLTLGPMRKLTARGIVLRNILESSGFKVIEAYPGGAQDVLGIPRKKHGLDKLRVGLEALGIGGLKQGLSDHELDAVTCAYVGKLFLEGKSVAYGPIDDAIIMPKGDKREKKI
jgi:predicted nuclease with RNAse H fold